MRLAVVSILILMNFALLFVNSVYSEEITFGISPLGFSQNTIFEESPENLISKSNYEKLLTSSQQCLMLNQNDKCFFYMQYAWLKLYGRQTVTRPEIKEDAGIITIISNAPLREINISGVKLPLSTLTQLHSEKFKFTLSNNQITGFIDTIEHPVMSIIDLSGNNTLHPLDSFLLEAKKNKVEAITILGLPCESFCTQAYAKIMERLSAQLHIPVIDGSNQQKVFNESVLCDASVLRGCDSQLLSSPEDLSMQALDNQWIIQYKQLEQKNGWVTAELLIARYSALSSETALVTAIFSREKNENLTFITLAEKLTAVIKLHLYEGA